MMKITDSDSRKSLNFIEFDEVWFNEEFTDDILARIIRKEGLKGESTFFEFKRELNIEKDVETLEEIMIMANGQSGILFYGWDEKRKDFSDINAEKTMKMITQWTRSEFSDRLQLKYRSIRYKEKNGLIILIPAVKHPLSVKGKLKIREGEEKTTLDGRKLTNFIEERKKQPVGHRYLNVLVARREEINQDLRTESLLIYRWSQKKIRPAGNENPCWFRPQGMTWIDVEANFFPVNTIHSLKIQIEDIWKEGKVVIIEANPASGKTSAGRVLATWWLDDFDYVYFLNVRDLEKEQGSMIINTLSLLGKTKTICLIIDDFHLFSKKRVIQEIQDIARNVRTCILSRPNSLSYQYKNELELKKVRFPSDYTRELVFQFFLKNEDLELESWITELLGKHDNSVAGLVYEIEMHLGRSPSEHFWREYINDIIIDLVRITKIPPSTWQELIILLSLFQTQEIQVSQRDIKTVIGGLSEKELELMLFHLDERGMIKKRDYKDESLYHLAYQSNFAKMILENHLKEFNSLLSHLNSERVIHMSESLDEIYKEFWNWWFENLASTDRLDHLIRTSNRANNVWKCLILNENFWKNIVSTCKTVYTYEIAILLQTNDHFQEDSLSWLTSDDWIVSFRMKFQKYGNHDSLDSYELYYDSYDSSDSNDFFFNWKHYDEVSFQDHCLEILQAQEWFFESSSVDDPGGNGFLPGSVYIPGGISWSVRDIISLLEESCKEKWVNCASRFVSLLINEKKDYSTFLAFLISLDDKTLTHLVPEQLPNAKQLVNIHQSHLEDFAKLEDIFDLLDRWAGPKVQKIAGESLVMYLEQFSAFLTTKQENEYSFYDSHIRTWFDYISVKSTEQVVSFYEKHADLILEKIDSDDLDIILTLISKWDPDYLENIWNAEIIRKLDHLPRYIEKHITKNLKICQTLLDLSANEFIRLIESCTSLLSFISLKNLIKYIESNPALQWLNFLSFMKKEIEKPIFYGYSVYSRTTTVKKALNLRKSLKTILSEIMRVILAKGMDFYLNQVTELIEEKLRTESKPKLLSFYFIREFLTLIGEFFPEFNSDSDIVYKWILGFIENKNNTVVKELVHYMLSNRRTSKIAIQVLSKYHDQLKNTRNIDTYRHRIDLSDEGREQLVSKILDDSNLFLFLVEEMPSICRSVLKDYVKNYINNVGSSIDLLNKISISNISNPSELVEKLLKIENLLLNLRNDSHSSFDLINKITLSNTPGSDKVIEKLLGCEEFVLKLVKDSERIEIGKKDIESFFNRLDMDKLKLVFRATRKTTWRRILQLISKDKIIQLAKELLQLRYNIVPVIYYDHPDGPAIVSELINSWKDKIAEIDVEKEVFEQIESWKINEHAVYDILELLEPLIVELEFTDVSTRNLDSLMEISRLPSAREKTMQITLNWVLKRFNMFDEVLEFWESSLKVNIIEYFKKQPIQLKESIIEGIIFEYSYSEVSQKKIEFITKILDSPLRVELYLKYFYRALYSQDSNIIKKLSNIGKFDPSINSMLSKIQENKSILLLTLVKEITPSIYTNRYQEDDFTEKNYRDAEFLALLSVKLGDSKINSVCNHILTNIYSPARVKHFIIKSNQFSDDISSLLAKYDIDKIIPILLRDEYEFISILLHLYETGSKNLIDILDQHIEKISAKNLSLQQTFNFLTAFTNSGPECPIIDILKRHLSILFENTVDHDQILFYVSLSFLETTKVEKFYRKLDLNVIKAIDWFRLDEDELIRCPEDDPLDVEYIKINFDMVRLFIERLLQFNEKTVIPLLERLNTGLCFALLDLCNSLTSKVTSTPDGLDFLLSRLKKMNEEIVTEQIRSTGSSNYQPEIFISDYHYLTKNAWNVLIRSELWKKIISPKNSAQIRELFAFVSLNKPGNIRDFIFSLAKTDDTILKILIPNVKDIADGLVRYDGMEKNIEADSESDINWIIMSILRRSWTLSTNDDFNLFYKFINDFKEANGYHFENWLKLLLPLEIRVYNSDEDNKELNRRLVGNTVWILDKNGWIYTKYWLDLYFYNKNDNNLLITIAALVKKSNYDENLEDFNIISPLLDDASKQEIEAAETLKS